MWRLQPYDFTSRFLDVPARAGLGVGDLVETLQLEAVRVAALPFVHVVAERQDHFENFPQSLTALYLLGRLHDGCEDFARLRACDGANRDKEKRCGSVTDVTFVLDET